MTKKLEEKRLTEKAPYKFVHVCIHDASRVAFSQILPDEKKESAVAFLRATVAYYANLGVTITRVMTDNGSCYRSKAFRSACRDLGLKHIRTKPYTPKTNGKAERFIQTALREWAYAQANPTSDHRAVALPIWLHRYNWHRPHSSLKSKPPISRLALTEDNLLRLHTPRVCNVAPASSPHVPTLRFNRSCHSLERRQVAFHATPARRRTVSLADHLKQGVLHDSDDPDATAVPRSAGRRSGRRTAAQHRSIHSPCHRRHRACAHARPAADRAGA